MRILAIETSCDETGLAAIDASPDKIRVLTNLVLSQIQTHRPFGGVVPHLAKREHEKALPFLWQQLQNKPYNLKPETIDLMAVTKGPGLAPCLWAGINFAQELARKLNKPLVGINHLKGHIYLALLGSGNPKSQEPNSKQIQNPKPQTLKPFQFPILSLIVSGGHTELVFSKKLGKYEIIGETRDDAAGEAFDKVAKFLGLSYPGGPIISSLAQNGNPERFDLPRPMINSKNFDFSFAGLKTSVLYLVKGLGGPGRQTPLRLNKKNLHDLAASFQQAVADVLVRKTIQAAEKLKPKTIILGGGVAANTLLRKELKRAVASKLKTIKLILPDPKLTTDNALMIALAAWAEHRILKRLKTPRDIQAQPNLRLGADQRKLC